MQSPILSVKVYAALFEGDAASAEALLAEWHDRLETPGGIDAVVYHQLAGWLALLRKDNQEAWQHVEKARNLVSAVGAVFYSGICSLGAAHVCHERGEREAAQRHLLDVKQIAEQMQSHLIRFACLMAEAHFDLDQGDETAAREDTYLFLRL